MATVTAGLFACGVCLPPWTAHTFVPAATSPIADVVLEAARAPGEQQHLWTRPADGLHGERGGVGWILPGAPGLPEASRGGPAQHGPAARRTGHSV